MTRRKKSRFRWLVWLLMAIAGMFLRRQRKPVPSEGDNQTVFWRVFDWLALFIDHKVGWDKLPKPLAILVLIGTRDVLRKKNLHDTTSQPTVNTPPIPPFDPAVLVSRTASGTYNDLGQPSMGMAESRFGRNVPLEKTFPEPIPAIMSPSPRDVSLKLMTRDPFIPATSVNALVAAWLQFMIRDWFSHGKSPVEDPWVIQLADDDPWPDHPMTVLRTRADPTRPAGSGDLPPTYVNTETHWWDASQIYGTTKAHQQQVRTGEDGKLRVGPDGLLPYPTDPERNPANVPGFWLGLAMLHTVFTLEHNAICDRLRDKHPSFTDEDLFQHARLVNAALIAKIHTVEWTPAVISHPATVTGLRANWWGLAGERVHKLFGRISSSEVISGIPGSQPQHYGVPYCLTEEFVAVYRMHPLVPDDYTFRSADDDSLIRQATLRDLAGPGGMQALEEMSMTDILYTFGTMHPGLVCLHNFPRFLQEFVRPDNGSLMDLASVDILRARELGVPRYNEFRRQLHLAPAKDFESLTDNPTWAAELREAYEGDIERLDLMPGVYAEKFPKNFAFSDTAFRIFILMASRRLNSDRFLTKDYTAQVYTKAGLDWIEDNTMTSVLLRHYPRLRTAMRGVDNAFLPWEPATL